MFYECVFFCAGTSTIKRMVKKVVNYFFWKCFSELAERDPSGSAVPALINGVVLVELPETHRGLKGFVGGEAETTTTLCLASTSDVTFGRP